MIHVFDSPDRLYMILNPYRFASGGAPPSGLLLDSIAGAKLAVSTRHLRTAYSGSCLRVRRSSDNAEQDIGFSGGWLDESALTTFVGANDGFVTTWYDQSGNGNDLTQSTAGNQPRIVASGTVDKQGSRPCVNSTATSEYLVNTSITGFSAAEGSVYAAANWVSGRRLVSWFSSIHSEIETASSNWSVWDAGTVRGTSEAAGFDLVTLIRQTSTADLFVSGGASAVSFTPTMTFASVSQIAVNARTNSTQGCIAKNLEAIYFNRDTTSDRATIEASINGAFSIY